MVVASGKMGAVSLEKLIKIHLSNKDRFFKPLTTLEKALWEYKIVMYGFMRYYEKGVIPTCISLRRNFERTQREAFAWGLIQFYECESEQFCAQLDLGPSWLENVTPQINDARLHW